MRRLKHARPRPALIVAVLALVAALAGTAVAEDATTSAKPVTKKKVKTIVNKLAPGLSVAHADTADTATNATNATNASNSDNSALLDNVDSSGFYRYGSSIPSGTTVTGAFGGQNAASASSFWSQSVSLPVPAPDGLTDAEVQFSTANAAKTGDADEDATCTGSPASPTAPAGKVCLYPTSIGADVTANSANATQLPGTAAGTGSRFGFGVNADSQSGTFDANISGTWAFTAP